MWIQAIGPDNIDYEHLTRAVRGNFADFDDLLLDPCPAKAVVMRHDVDRDIAHALKFAEFEIGLGIRSTYFLLHSAPYFDYSSSFASQCSALIAMGHKIGLHNNALTEWLNARDLGEETPPENYLKRPLAFLRSIPGVCITGTSLHGDLRCYKDKYSNCHLFSEVPKKNTLPYGQIPLASLGLRYEANFVPRKWLVHDSGGKWSQDLFKVIEEFNNAQEGILQILVHPLWWKGVS